MSCSEIPRVAIKKKWYLFKKIHEKSSSLVELYTQRSFTKNCFTYVLIEQFEEHLLVAASKTRELKHMHWISKRVSISLAYKELLK